MTAEGRRELIERAATELFAERGYRGASMDAIARAAGVTVPVLYDHFASKLDLHRRLLERHYAELRELWAEQLAGDDPPRRRIPRAVDAWFAYVESHRFAWRMLFQDTTGDPRVEPVRRQVAAESRAAVLPLLVREEGAANIAGPDAESMDMAWEIVRAVLQGLATWWYEHPHVPRDRIVATAVNALWLGFERTLAGETWNVQA